MVWCGVAQTSGCSKHQNLGIIGAAASTAGVHMNSSISDSYHAVPVARDSFVVADRYTNLVAVGGEGTQLATPVRSP